MFLQDFSTFASYSYEIHQKIIIFLELFEESHYICPLYFFLAKDVSLFNLSSMFLWYTEWNILLQKLLNILFPEMPKQYIMRRQVSWKWCWSGRVEWNADPSMFLWDAKWKEAWFAFTEFVTEIPVSISRHSLLFPQQNLSSRSIWHPQTLPSSQIHKPQSAWIFDICR